MLDISTLPALVDELTSLNTQIAVLTAKADQIKKDLISTGLSEVCGSNTRAVISKIASGYTTDWHAVADYLQPSAEVIGLFQKERAGYTKLEVKGYNARKAA